MLKNNALHISLIALLGLAIVSFVVFQMNVSSKKLLLDIVKVNKDITKINDDISGLTVTISHLHKMLNNNIMGVNANTSVTPLATESCKNGNSCQISKSKNIDNEVDMIDINDLKKIIEDADEKDDELKSLSESSTTSDKNVDSMTYEEVREMCKKFGLSPKGKRDQLIERVKTHLKTI